MNKKCENCYWNNTDKSFERWCRLSKDQPEENVCKSHSFKCEECGFERADFNYNNKCYCERCLMSHFDVWEEEITKYYLDGELLGTSDDMYEVIENLDADIKTLR